MGISSQRTRFTLPAVRGLASRGAAGIRAAALSIRQRMQNTRAYVLEIRKADLFRPCVSSTDTATSACEMSPSAAKPRLQADIDDSQYVIEKLWTAHSTGFSEIGYPFTGMGWTYNWNPLSRDHIGVSEYVGRKDASVNIKAVLTADDSAPAPISPSDSLLWRSDSERREPVKRRS
ncbi:hypothetical protein BYI23_D015660 (plasmid) [Burkholderia sp. YI23]|nr:hypothetical protein BYI23_D015660 [Burkholderia sp. YI23]